MNMDMNDMTPDDVREMKMRRRTEKAYDQATGDMEPEMAPIPRKATKRPAQMEEMMQEVKDAKDRKKISDMGYAKGGSVSASKRADGCAVKGKTRGKMV
jgi:hypothetical protein